jgi:tRNA(Ile)-lysidine synthase
LSIARRGNALRAWLKQQMGRNPGAKLAQRLMTELPAHRPARWYVGDGELQLYRGVLRYRRGVVAAIDAVLPETTVAIDGPGDYLLPGWRGSLHVMAVAEGGIALEHLARLELRPRDGGERFRAAPGRPVRSLKKQYQAAAVPAWEREGPLCYVAGRLIYVPGLGLDADALEPGAAHQMALHWRLD